MVAKSCDDLKKPIVNKTSQFLVLSYWKCIWIIWIFLFILVSRDEIDIIYHILPFIIKSINPVQSYLHIMELYACILQIFVMIRICINVFNSRTIKECCMKTIHMQSYPLSSYLLKLIIYYIGPILYLYWFIFWINTIKFGLIFKISLYFKITETIRQHEKSCSFTSSYYSLTC